MTLAPRSATAFEELLSLLTQVKDEYVLSSERFTDELDAVEGFRYALQVLSEASELLVEGDPERPRFSSIVSPARKMQGDNPDALYQQAVIRGDRSYRIRGRVDRQTYVSFTIHGPDPNGGLNGPVLADKNHHDFDLASDGSFELTLSADERPGTWIPLAPEARYVIVRNYYQQDPSAQNDPTIHVQLEIEPLDDPGPPPPLDDATLAQRLRDATGFVRAITLSMRVFGDPPAFPVPFVSEEPNTVGPPWCFRNADVEAAGAVDIYYSSGSFDLGPDDALVMEGTLPECEFVNVMLWNVHMQTLDYRDRRCSLNGEQIETGADGTYRIVISQRDPGVANWIDTGGHRQGTIFWRFLLPTAQPDTPQCRVVPVNSLA